jgi:hypothetical protein
MDVGERSQLAAAGAIALKPTARRRNGGRSDKSVSHHDSPHVEESNMNKIRSLGLVLGSAALALALAAPVAAHNRAHIILPTGECIVVGSEKSVTMPDGSLLDLRPETVPADEIGAAYAADEGNSRLQKFGCP